MQYRSTHPSQGRALPSGFMLLYCIQSEGLVDKNYYFLVHCFHGYNKQCHVFTVALKNCMNVCPGPQELYNSKRSLQGGSVYSTLYTLTTT